MLLNINFNYSLLLNRFLSGNRKSMINLNRKCRLYRFSGLLSAQGSNFTVTIS